MSEREDIWKLNSFAVVGNSQTKRFPKVTYSQLKGKSKTVFPVDLGGGQVEGDTTYKSLSELPSLVEMAVIEVPKQETAGVVKQCADAGVKRVWIHMGTDTQEALDLCKENQIDELHGACAVCYTMEGFSLPRIPCYIHKGLGKLFGAY